MLHRILVLFLVYSFFCLTIAEAKAQVENQAIILQYHHVSTQTPAITSLSPEAFRIHMAYLRENNFTVLALEDVIKRLRDESSLPDKTAVITFDDGYKSVYDEAFPLLKTYDWPFTIFVTTGLVGSNDALYASWEQIQEMADAGATIANHTVSHPYLLEQNGQTESQWLEEVRSEVTQAENAISNQTGQNHKLLAYPYGEYNTEIQTLINEMGFVGFAQHSGPINAQSDFTALPRFPFSGIYASMNAFPTKVMSLAFSLDSVSPESPVTNAVSPEAILDFSANQEGLLQLACYNNNQLITVELVDTERRIYTVTSTVENNSRRFRYNCTAPGKDKRYFWQSIPWFNPEISE